MTMMKPSNESKTAKRIWKRAERRSVMASTADIQVRANRGRTTQELHSDALQERRGTTRRVLGNKFISEALWVLFFQQVKNLWNLSRI